MHPTKFFWRSLMYRRIAYADESKEGKPIIIGKIMDLHWENGDDSPPALRILTGDEKNPDLIWAHVEDMFDARFMD